MRLPGVAVVITGAGGGIGRALALAFAGEGAVLVLGDLGNAATRVAEAVTRNGGSAVALAADVWRGADMGRLAKTAMGTFGRLDVLVTCAGIDGAGLLAEQDETVWTRVSSTSI